MLVVIIMGWSNYKFLLINIDFCSQHLKWRKEIEADKIFEWTPPEVGVAMWVWLYASIYITINDTLIQSLICCLVIYSASK